MCLLTLMRRLTPHVQRRSLARRARLAAAVDGGVSDGRHSARAVEQRAHLQARS